MKRGALRAEFGEVRRAITRLRWALLPVGLALALASCGEEQGDAEAETEADSVGTEAPNDGVSEATGDTEAPDAQVEGATPMAERVATIGLLNKRNNVSLDLELKPGEVAEEGPVIVRLEACERTAPYEFPQETGAFVQVDVLERGANQRSRVFSGWLFKQNPSLNVVEHPIYDVWIKDCAMSFPGEE